MDKMKRIMAWAGILLLAAIYLVTFLVGLMGKADAKDLLMGCILSTVLVPVVLYAMLMTARHLRGAGLPEGHEDSEDAKNAGQKMPAAADADASNRSKKMAQDRQKR